MTLPQPLSHSARVAGAATQPLCQSGCVSVAEWLSGWGENFRHCAFNRKNCTALQSNYKQLRLLRPFHVRMKVIPTLRLFRLYSLGLVLPVFSASISARRVQNLCSLVLLQCCSCTQQDCSHHGNHSDLVQSASEFKTSPPVNSAVSCHETQ